jgi:hypothetical protein
MMMMSIIKILVQAGLVYLTQMLCQNKTQVKLTFGFGLHMQSVVKSQTYVDILWQ